MALESTGWIGAQRKSKKGVSSMLQVVQWAFSFSLYGRRRFIQAWQRKQPELCTQTEEAGAEIQDVGSRIQTFSSKDEKWGIGAIWLPGSPGTPGLAHSRTGTAPRTSTDNEEIISMNFQSSLGCSYFNKFRSYLVIKCSNLVPGVLFLHLLSVKGNISILQLTKPMCRPKQTIIWSCKNSISVGSIKLNLESFHTT